MRLLSHLGSPNADIDTRYMLRGNPDNLCYLPLGHLSLIEHLAYPLDFAGCYLSVLVSVLYAGNSLKMFGIDTCLHLASMVEFHTWPRSPILAFIVKAMRTNGSSLDRFLPVSSFSHATLPYPARSLVASVFEHILYRRLAPLMSSSIANGFSLYPPDPILGSRRYVCLLSAPALTEPLGYNVAHKLYLLSGIGIPGGRRLARDVFPSLRSIPEAPAIPRS